MLLFLAQDLADVLSDRVLLQRFALLQALAVVPDGVVLVLEVGPQHHLGLVAEHDRLRAPGRHPAEVVDVARNGDRVLQLLARVHFQLRGDVHVGGALERLRIDDVGDDRLVFPGKVLVQTIDQFFPCDDLICHV